MTVQQKGGVQDGQVVKKGEGAVESTGEQHVPGFRHSNFLRQHGAELEDREIHCHDKTADDDAEEHYHQWFHQGGKIGYGVVYFFVIKISNLDQHRVQCAGGLADVNHLA